MKKLSGLLFHSDQQYYLLSDCMKYKRCRYKYEDLIVENRVNEYSLSELTDEERKVALGRALVDISLIVGASLPDNDELLDVFISLFDTSLMKFGYENLSAKELSIAFILDKQCVLKDEQGDLFPFIKDPHINLNVGYIIRVLKNYLIARNLLDAKAKNTINGEF